MNGLYKLVAFILIFLSLELKSFAITFDNSQNLAASTQVYKDNFIVKFRSEVIESGLLSKGASLINSNTGKEIEGMQMDEESFVFSGVSGKDKWILKTSYEGVVPDPEDIKK